MKPRLKLRGTPPIRQRIAYIDKLALWTTVVPTGAELLAIRESTLLGKPLTVQVKRGLWDTRFVCRLSIPQPTVDTFQLLTALAKDAQLPRGKPGLLLNYLEVALDLMTDTREEAVQLKRYLKNRILQPHTKVEMYQEEGTCYTRPRKWGTRGMAFYGRRLSKVSGLPAAHLEMRFYGRKQLRSLGVRNPVDAGELNLPLFWKRHLRLREVDWALLERQKRGCPKRKTPTFPRGTSLRYNTYGRNDTFILHRHSNTQDTVFLYGKCHWFRKSCLKPVDTSHFLPTNDLSP